MEVFLSHQTALQFWRQCRLARPGFLVRASEARVKPPMTPSDIKSWRANIPAGLSEPLNIMVGSQNARKISKGFASHYCKGSFPRNSFARTKAGYFVSGAEFCFLQMATILPLANLIQLGFELCGGYVLAPEDASGFIKSKPVTTVARLRAFVNKMSGFHGCKLARKALQYILDGSASPRETILAVLLVLPYRLGGFGLAKPQLNFAVTPQRTARKATEKQCFYCDLYWPDARLAVEYDSDMFHAGIDQIAGDAKRRAALAFIGTTVVTVTNRQVSNSLEMKRVASLLAKHLGKTIRCQDPSFTNRHVKLRKQLVSCSNLTLPC